MKVALITNRDSFENHSKWNDTGWELIHIGDSFQDSQKVIATGADVIVVGAGTKIGADIIENMPQLKLIHSQGVAFNAIDHECAKNAKIYVCNNAGVNARPVAEQTILLILALLKEFRYNEDMVLNGRQQEAQQAALINGNLELGECSVGIVGFGAIGKELATLLRPFGCELFYYDLLGDSGKNIASYLPLEDLLARCDIISLHAPVTSSTINMINEKTLETFKTGAILVNMARGELVDNIAVVNALKSGKLNGFGADTIAPEPVSLDNPILKDLPIALRRKIALSPHIAGINAAMLAHAYVRIRQNIEALSCGQRPNCIVNDL